MQRNRDYVAKRLQYEALSVSEYWIVDPQTKTILILVMVDGHYTDLATLRGNALLQSPQLGSLGITIAEIFAEGSWDSTQKT